MRNACKCVTDHMSRRAIPRMGGNDSGEYNGAKVRFHKIGFP
jgi:hypothetical protein